MAMWQAGAPWSNPAEEVPDVEQRRLMYPGELFVVASEHRMTITSGINWQAGLGYDPREQDELVLRTRRDIAPQPLIRRSVVG